MTCETLKEKLYFTENLHFSNGREICLSKSETKLRKLCFYPQIN